MDKVIPAQAAGGARMDFEGDAAFVVAAPDALARMTGRALPRIGHRLQSWTIPAAVEGDAALGVATPGTPWWKEGC